ncbi:hypothetical protein Pla22_45600 [Rubripirellula amarantea]|uniref:Uncharacterized protein n=1 Tax=Rubripirellula amarantea TaxID=2527999 RepID=A0A5C5WF29_9BACT|nr:hypothetical protein [Rubripirellula amarantea]TWT49364.1 hypothetical protein Pla22_45600 [Rubripirellula amarantea]
MPMRRSQPFVVNRRQAIRGIAVGCSLPMIGGRAFAEEGDANPPVRAITRGPLQHWFGYYDKLEFDPTNRYVLSNEVAFEHRTPTADDTVRVGMVDTQDNDKWIRLGSSSAWGWQQGCMLQWRPGSSSEVVWNDRQGDSHVCRVLNVETKQLRTLPRPIYSLSGNGKWGITTDFSRVQRMRPGYGYVGLQDPASDKHAPEDSGVWKMNMDTGETELIFSLADAAKLPHQGESLAGKWNYFNHLLVSPDSSRFVVLHRWREAGENGPVGGFKTRMFTVAMDGSQRYVLDPSGETSHFIWRDPEHICAWTRPDGKPSGFYLFKDQSDQVETVGEGVMTQNGHNTYLPGTEGEWILNDTYPDSKTRLQTVYLYHVPTRRKVVIGRFHSPREYSGEWRCDTHPRSSNDGKSVVIDSPHHDGRQLHMIDISKVVG